MAKQCGTALFSSRVLTPFGYLSRVLLTFKVMARRAEKNFRTVQGFPKGQARVSKQYPRVFLHHLVFSVRYFYKNLPKGQEKEEPRVFLHPLVFSEGYFFPFKVQPRVQLEGIQDIWRVFIPSKTPKYRQLKVSFHTDHSQSSQITPSHPGSLPVPTSQITPYYPRLLSNHPQNCGVLCPSSLIFPLLIYSWY